MCSWPRRAILLLDGLAAACLPRAPAGRGQGETAAPPTSSPPTSVAAAVADAGGASCATRAPSAMADRQRYLHGLLADRGRYDITGALEAVQEPPLSSVSAPTYDIYRWGNVHDEWIRVVRVETDGDSCIATVTFRANRGKNCWIANLRTAVDQPACSDLSRCLAQANFDTLPADDTEDHTSRCDDAGTCTYAGTGDYRGEEDR